MRLIGGYDYRVVCLIVACIIYAIFGSPTPNNIGFSEILVGVLLVLGVGIVRFREVFIQKYKVFWQSSGQLFFIYGLSVPLIVAVLSGNGLGAILRDIVPFLFLFIPLFFLPLLRERPSYFKGILVAVIMIGLLFSLRSLMMRYADFCFFDCSGELLYLENMPTVLFSCLYMIGLAISFIMRGVSVRNITIFSILIMLSIIPIIAMAVTLQRASIGAVVAYIIIIQLYFLYKSPVRAFAFIVIGAVALFILNISFLPVFMLMLEKTKSVGLNMRPQELVAVWDIVTTNPLVFLFGIGWGGQFNSPAVGGLSVNFTHNFFTTMLLKTGIIGVVSCTAYILGVLERLSRVIFKNPVLGLAIFAPVLIDLTLYASFKSLDFGLVLLMIFGSLIYLRQFESL